MRYHGIEKCSLVNGDGIRVVLWVAGCNHYCKGCHNPSTWDPEGGLLFDEQAKATLFERLNRDYYSGVTFSGGDPLYPANREDITALAKELKELYPDKTVWLYTGYLWEEVKELEVMQYVDVLVDGEFKEELAEVSYHWAGSTNQKVIDVRESIKNGKLQEHRSV